MKYTILGKSDLKVSSICMGCMGFGNPLAGQHSWTVNEEETRRIIGRGLEKGINFFDTAIAYQGGTSEMYVGSALKSLAKRDEYVIATKFTPRTPKEIEDGVDGQTHIKNYIDMSLKNLGMDYVDLYIYHMWDYNTPMEQIMEGLHAVVKAGKARYIGISNCFAWQLAKANYFARANGLTEFISVQGHYNLIAREEEREMAPFCASEGISMTPYSALAGGRLSKRPGESSKRLEEDAYAKFKYDLTKEADEKIIKRVEEVADKRGVSMTEVALGWLIQKGAVPVVGATKDSHVDGAVKAVDLTLTEDEIRYLEELYVLPAPVLRHYADQRMRNI